MTRWVLAVALMAGWLAAGTTPPRLLYSKYFKGSVPESVFITVEKSGQVIYKEALDDERPLKFALTEAQAGEMFALAETLGHFSRTLESPLKVAQMGVKTFRWEQDGGATEAKFNFTEDPDARLLSDWFERMIETQQNYYILERAVKFDKLGVNQALLQLQLTLERKRILAPEQFLPLLDRIVRNESYMHMARERAANLAETFRKSGP